MRRLGLAVACAAALAASAPQGAAAAPLPPQEIADGAGRRSAIVLQAFSWAGYLPNYAHAPWPSADEMRRMRDLVVRDARPALILWYSFQDALRPQAPAGHFGALVSAAFGPPPQGGPRS